MSFGSAAMHASAPGLRRDLELFSEIRHEAGLPGVAFPCRLRLPTGGSIHGRSSASAPAAAASGAPAGSTTSTPSRPCTVNPDPDAPCTVGASDGVCDLQVEDLQRLQDRARRGRAVERVEVDPGRPGSSSSEHCSAA